MTDFTKETKPTTVFTKETKHSASEGFDFAVFDDAVFDGKPQTQFIKETKPITIFQKETKSN